jgi:hypothetical protein
MRGKDAVKMLVSVVENRDSTVLNANRIRKMKSRKSLLNEA